MLLVTLSVTGFAAVASYFPQILDAKQAIFQYVSGKFSLASNCQVEFHWEDPAPVGKTVSFFIRVSVSLALSLPRVSRSSSCRDGNAD